MAGEILGPANRGFPAQRSQAVPARRRPRPAPSKMATVFGESHALVSFLRAVHCIDSRMVVSDLAEFDRLLIARRILLLQQRQTLPAEIVIEAAQRMRDLERDESVQVLKLTTSGDLFAERTTGALAQVTALRMRSGLFFRRWLWRIQASWLQARLARLRRNNAREHSQALLSLRQSRERLLCLQADPEGCAAAHGIRVWRL